MPPAESASPERPPGIPASGRWDDSIDKWEAVEHVGAGGAREGECLRFRADGTLYSRSHFVAGLEDGPFTVYHPDGSVAREGRRAAGRVQGVVNAYASADGNGDPLRPCCVPPGATRMELDYRRDDYPHELFYDSQGRVLLSDGGIRPPQPPGLPAFVAFEESRGDWVLRSPTLDRYWSVDGRPVEEEARSPDGRRSTRLFDDAGEVREERVVDADGRRVGRFFSRLPPDVSGPYADPRIRQERGTFEAGQVVGVWTFLDAAGAVVLTIDRGAPVSSTLAETSPAFDATLVDGWAVARALVGQGRVREALCAAARAAARSGEREALLAFLGEHVVPLAPAVEAERGDALARSGEVGLVAALDALVDGAEAASVFRVLGTLLPGASPAVVDFVEASLLLAPGRSSTHITRALVRTQRGDEAGARADAQVVEVESSGAAESLRQYLDLVFRPFTLPALWNELPSEPSSGPGPESAESEAEIEGERGGVEQSLEAIQHLAAVYATRIGRVREAVVSRSGCEGAPASAPRWLPPELSALLPEGPVALLRETVTCDPDPESGVVDTIEIDEGLALDGLAVPALLSLAHADYAALAWLCWSTGLARIERPRAIEPPGALITGMRAIVQRHWRADDRGKTGGLVALGKGIAGFEWEGFAVDEMPDHVLADALAELLAARSMFLWLLSPDTMSPFQDDIRGA